MAKVRLEELAALGGTPAFQDKIHVGRPNIGNREHLDRRINDMLDRRWLSNNGPYVQEFERKVANLVGVKHCIAICNATIGLEIAIRATNLKGEVIVPSFTFIATPHALQWQEITPVFCDAEPQTHNIDPCRVEDMITPRTAGIIGVHVWGRACDITALTDIAQRNNLKLLFDAAHAFGCSHMGKMIGNFGDVEVFSFHATKFFNAFEGGAVVTNNDDLAARIRLMKNFGFAGNDNVICIGTNGKMTEVSAAMGLTSLESLEEIIAVNYLNYKQYKKELASIPGVRMAVFDEAEKNNYQYIVLEIDETITGITRDDILRILVAENVQARRYFYPGCHRMEPYRSYFPQAGLSLPVTERLANRVLCLPTGQTVGRVEIETICEIIRISTTNAEEINLRFAAVKSSR